MTEEIRSRSAPQARTRSASPERSEEPLESPPRDPERPGRNAVARILVRNQETRKKGNALRYCKHRKGDTPTAGRAARKDWRCHVDLCPQCAKVKKHLVSAQYIQAALDTAAQIEREDPGRPRHFLLITLTTPRQSIKFWRGFESTGYRREIAVRAFTFFRYRIDWFKRSRPQSLSSQRWPRGRKRSTLDDSFAVAGWHIGKGWPHLHLLVYGADYINKTEIGKVWKESYRRAYDEVKESWRAKSKEETRLSNFLPYTRAWKVDVARIATPLRNNVFGSLKYLVDDGLSDAEMAEDPFGVAASLTVWHDRELITPYGRIRGKLSNRA